MQATLSHYRVLEQIGEGGMGVVYRAQDEHLDRDVALKVLPSGALADEAARKRFRKEALALSKLNHPNIATVFDFDTEEGTDFLVEELVQGMSLEQMLHPGPLTEKEIVDLGSQLCHGLAAAHEQGIVHRDLKPTNPHTCGRRPQTTRAVRRWCFSRAGYCSYAELRLTRHDGPRRPDS